MTRADAVVVGLAALLIGALFGRYWQAPAPADTVEIRRGGELVLRASLDADRRVDVPGAAGTSVIEIQGLRARFADGPCRNRICVRAGWLAYAAETAACLPNGVSIQLSGGAHAFDAISR